MGIALPPAAQSPVNGFDCSGFIRYVFQSSGVNLAALGGRNKPSHPGQPRRAQARRRVVLQTPVASITRTTGCIWQWPFIHAPRTGKNIEITSPERQLPEQLFQWRPAVIRRGRGGMHEATDDVKRAESLEHAAKSAKKPAP